MARAQYPKFNWDATDLAEELETFRQCFELCLEDDDVTDLHKAALKLKLSLGGEGIRRIRSGINPNDQNRAGPIWKLLKAQLGKHVNYRIHRLELSRFSMNQGEAIDQFVSRCREKAVKCDFEPQQLNERIQELVIASTNIVDFQKELLQQDRTFSLDDMLNLGRRYEGIKEGTAYIQSLRDSQHMDAVQSRCKPVAAQGTGKACGNCGRQHPPKQCPAYQSECNFCKCKGHWEKFCRKKNRAGQQNSADHNQQQHRVDTTESSAADDGTSNRVFDAIHIDAVDKRSQVISLFSVKAPYLHGNCKIKLKVDTGSAGNTLPVRTVRQMYGEQWEKHMKPGNHRLTAYSGDPIPCYGSMKLQLQYKDSGWTPHEFFVVDVTGPAIIGLPSCEVMNVVSIHSVERDTKVKSLSDLISRYPEQFDRIGRFKETATLHLKDGAMPWIDPPRKTPVNLLSRIEAELGRMEKDGVVRKVDHHTDWCSSMVIQTKKDGSLRLCIDPKRLNDALRRCPHKIPTLEELNPKFANAKYLSKLDAKSGYWTVPLDQECQELTTFRTHIGRYCFQRLPFGLRVSQDIFQSRMDRILTGLPGCISIADDIVVTGTTEEEHDRNLTTLLEAAKANGLAFNSTKCRIKEPSITFFGRIYSADGIQPDPNKVSDLKAMPTPQTTAELHTFLSFANYLAAHMPKFAEKTAILYDLLQKDVPFQWHDDHQAVFGALKASISDDSLLSYYDTQKTVTLEVDASGKGLGACLTQDGKPVAFASKRLSPAEQHYSNIERETLALVFGVTRFHTYLFGRHFIIESDHRPLEMICRKSLMQAPPRLQRLLVKIQGYDFTVRHKRGVDMIMSDALSRFPTPHEDAEVKLDVSIDSVAMNDDTLLLVDTINFGNTGRQQLVADTSTDPVLIELKCLIQSGWPGRIQDIPDHVRPYWSFRDELGLADGAIFKGRQVVIPPTMRSRILTQLHIGHMGIGGTRRLSRETVYWPNINSDIEQMIKQCATCQKHAVQQQREPLIPHEIPSEPWTKLASDLFQLDGRDYIILTDYHTKFPIVRQLSSTTSASVARQLSDIFSLLGAPREIVSDNGPQYVGPEFQALCRTWGILHTTSSPRYPQSNGLAERNVRTIKNLLKKCKATGQDFNVALSQLRATPIDGNIRSPAELMFGRPIRTGLPCHLPGSRTSETIERLREKSGEMKKHYDHRAGEKLPELSPGQPVRTWEHRSQTWQPATLTEACPEPRSYNVTTNNGTQLRRNRTMIRAVTAPREDIAPPEANDDERNGAPREAPSDQRTERVSNRLRRKPPYLMDYDCE